MILQDEALVLAELKRARANAESSIPARVPAPAPGPGPASVAPPAMVSPTPTAPSPPPPVPETPAEAEPVKGAGETAAPDTLVSLPELAREAAMRAERAAIQHALDRYRWNRRKAADALGVSYKTLLNKMKECGISEQQA